MIDEVMAKYNLQPGKYYRTSILYNIMKDLGLVDMQKSSFASDFINRNIERGRLKLWQKGANDRWFFTGQQIREIVEAWSPGGAREWSYNKPEEKTGLLGTIKNYVEGIGRN